MKPTNITLVSILTSIGMVSAAFAAPVGRVNQCPAPWKSDSAATCPTTAASRTCSLANVYDQSDEPRVLTVAEIKAELAAIRLNRDEQLAANAQRTRTGD